MSADKITPRTVRLRSGVEVVNGITGETGPTFSEYVLLSDYEELQRENAALREQLAERDAENSKLRSALEIVHFKREPWQ